MIHRRDKEKKIKNIIKMLHYSNVSLQYFLCPNTNRGFSNLVKEEAYISKPTTSAISNNFTPKTYFKVLANLYVLSRISSVPSHISGSKPLPSSISNEL